MTPSRTDVDLPTVERQHLATLLRRVRYLTLRCQADPARIGVRRELKATMWVLCALGGSWGLAMTDEARSTLAEGLHR
jgi:hypothetical protein